MAHNPVPLCRSARNPRSTSSRASRLASTTHSNVIPITETDARHESRYDQKLCLKMTELCATSESIVAVIDGVTLNVSRAGICVSTSVPLTPLACVRCEFPVPGLHLAMPTLMQVRWVRQMPDDSFTCGLMYLV
jgi:hypothetical protein